MFPPLHDILYVRTAIAGSNRVDLSLEKKEGKVKRRGEWRGELWTWYVSIFGLQ